MMPGVDRMTSSSAGRTRWVSFAIALAIGIGALLIALPTAVVLAEFELIPSLAFAGLAHDGRWIHEARVGPAVMSALVLAIGLVMLAAALNEVVGRWPIRRRDLAMVLVVLGLLLGSVAWMSASVRFERRVMQSAYGGSWEALNAALRDRDVDTRLRGGTTALMWAAAGGHGDVVDALIERGADVEAANVAGWTALMYAAGRTVNEPFGSAGAVRVLIEQGARVDVTDAAGVTPLTAAIASGDDERVRLLRGSE
jgi:hypothetical protein